MAAGAIELGEGTVPANPATNRWKLFFKSDGVYTLDDAGAEVGPLAAGAGSPETLATTLAAGNTTGGTDLEIGTGDELVFQDTPDLFVSRGAAGQLNIGAVTEGDEGAVYANRFVVNSGANGASMRAAANGVVRIRDIPETIGNGQLHVGTIVQDAATDAFQLSSGGVHLSAPAQVVWVASGNASPFGTVDTWLSRGAVGQVDVNATTAGGGDGVLLSGVVVEANTAVAAGPNVISGEYGKVFTNEGATAENHHDLPTAVAGARHTFIVQDTDGIQVNASTGDTIRIAGTVSASGGFVSSITIGDVLRLIAINTTEWVALTPVMGWTFDT